MTIDQTELRKTATAVRQIFEETEPKSDDDPFRDFPSGACGPAAELLGRYLKQVIGLDAGYVKGTRPDGQTHAWLQVNGTIIDITADQFGQDAVIVTQESPWHDEWNASPPRPPACSPDQWRCYPHALWDAVLDGMRTRGFPCYV